MVYAALPIKRIGNVHQKVASTIVDCANPSGIKASSDNDVTSCMMTYSYHLLEINKYRNVLLAKHPSSSRTDVTVIAVGLARENMQHCQGLEQERGDLE